MLRNDKGLSVMYYKRVKCIVRTADCDFFSFYQIQYIHTIVAAYPRLAPDRESPCFDKLKFVQACMFFLIGISFDNRPFLINQVFLYP